MDWLPQEYPNIRVLGLNYETSISEWSLNLLCPCEKNKSSLHDRSEELLNALSASNVGRDCPVIWVGANFLQFKHRYGQKLNNKYFMIFPGRPLHGRARSQKYYCPITFEC